MKRLLKYLIILIGLLILFIVLMNFFYEQITPRVIGSAAFPLEKTLNFCVGERIREISSSGDFEILLKTDSTLSAYTIGTGTLTWEAHIKKQVESFPPVVAGQKVFVSDDDHLWAFDLETGKTLWNAPLKNVSSWIPDASERFVLLNSVSGYVDVYGAESGKKLWGVRGGRGYTPAFIDQDKVYILDRGVKALNAFTGELVWEIDNERPTGVGIFIQNTLYYIEYTGSQTFDLVAYNTEGHVEIWRNTFTDNNLPRGLYAHDGFLYIVENNVFYQINRGSGDVTWMKNLSDPTNLSFVNGQIYVLEQFHRIVHVLDIGTGKELAALQISLPQIVGSKTQEMIAVGKRLVFSRGCEVFVYDN